MTDLHDLKGKFDVQTFGEKNVAVGPEKCEADRPLYRHCIHKS